MEEEDGELSAWCIELNAFPNMNHNLPRTGSKQPRQNEVDFRTDGFDRDLMRIIGLEEQDDTPNGWLELLPALAT